MSQLNGSKQQPSFGCGRNGCGNHGSLCPTCEESFMDSTKIKCLNGNSRCTDITPCDTCFDKLYPKTNCGAVGGGKARDDVVPLQDVHDLCQDCQENPDPKCTVCAMIQSTQQSLPFTKGQVDILHYNLGNIFAKLPKERRFNLSVQFDTVSVGTINWCFHNCAFASFVQMLSNSNAGLNSINQQKFAGYLLALIANSLQENGRCEAILIEVFRLELTIFSGNQAWSNWSELAFFGELYSFCVKHRIIIANDFIFVLPNDDGSSYDIGQVLDGKNSFAVLEAQNWSPSIEHLSYGIFSMNRDSKFRILSVVLYSNDHFSIVVISQGIWHIDGKGKRTGEFTAESTMRELSINEFQELCRQCGAFYFLEQVPVEYENLILSGSQGLPPRRILYANNPYFLYESGTLFCEKSRKLVNLQRPIFVSDLDGNHFRVFPPPPPHLPAPCAQVVRALPPPPPAPFEKVSQPLPSPPEPEAPTVRFDHGFFRHIRDYPNKWTYMYQHGTVFFKAEGTFEDPPYSDRKYFYNGREYCGSLIQPILRDACVDFLKANLPK